MYVCETPLQRRGLFSAVISEAGDDSVRANAPFTKSLDHLQSCLFCCCYRFVPSLKTTHGICIHFVHGSQHCFLLKNARRNGAFPHFPTANLRTKILEFRVFDAIIILVLRGGIPGPNPESLSQGILVGIILVGRLVVLNLSHSPKLPPRQI